MPNFRTQKQVQHSAEDMFALVADIERYPEFLPMCEALTIRSRQEQDGNILLLADMRIGYKIVRESFTTQVYLRPRENRIDVQYIDGPFKYLENRWQFCPAGGAEGSASHIGGAERQAVDAADKSAEAAAPAAKQDSAETALPAAQAKACTVDFYIDYAFKNPMLSALMGAMFDIAFRKFTAAFVARADKIYGANS